MKFLGGIFILLFYALPGSYGEKNPALGNFEVYALAREFHEPVKERVHLIGKRVSIGVTMQTREDGTVFGNITNPKKEFEPIWAAHLTNLKADFFDNIEPGKEYVINGVIVEDRMDYGAFWIHVNEYEKVEPAVIVNAGAAPRRD